MSWKIHQIYRWLPQRTKPPCSSGISEVLGIGLKWTKHIPNIKAKRHGFPCIFVLVLVLWRILSVCFCARIACVKVYTVGVDSRGCPGSRLSRLSRWKFCETNRIPASSLSSVCLDLLGFDANPLGDPPRHTFKVPAYRSSSASYLAGVQV
jgi:hypothetical protein